MSADASIPANTTAPRPPDTRALLLFALVACLFIGTGFAQSWNTALTIFNMGLVSAIMALGVNMQWGYAGLFNVGVMGFVALGGLAAVLVSMPPVGGAWAAGGVRVLLGLVLGAATIVAAILAWSRLPPGRMRGIAMIVILVGGFFLYRAVFDAGVAAVEAVDPAATGYLGGLGFARDPRLARGRASGGGCCLDHRQDRAWPPVRLPRHCHARYRRDHHRGPEKTRTGWRAASRTSPASPAPFPTRSICSAPKPSSVSPSASGPIPSRSRRSR